MFASRAEMRRFVCQIADRTSEELEQMLEAITRPYNPDREALADRATTIRLELARRRQNGVAW